MRKIAALLLALLSLTVSFPLATQEIRASSATLVVPDNYSTVQGAVNNAANGDTVFVKAGQYYENVVLNKSIHLLGEGEERTFLYTNRSGPAIFVVADGTTVSGFTIQNSGSNMIYGHDGISVASDNNKIYNNIVTDNVNHGIFLNNSNGNIIENNVVSFNYWCGIVLRNSDYNTITNNSVIQNLQQNNGVGIKLQDNSDLNRIENNTITKNNAGIGFESYSSTVGGCSDNIVRSNIISDNDFDGIFLYDYGQRNRIEHNELSGNGGGVHLSNSINNVIVGNNISRSTYGGIGFEHSQFNIFYHNNLANNTPQIWYFSNGNAWDNGYPSGGNYWSDYAGTDTKKGANQTENGNDGIGDTPYAIDAENKDNYPLMTPFTQKDSLQKLVSFSDSFKDSSGASLYVPPSSFRLMSPNGTTSPPLATGTHLTQTGTSLLHSIIWQGTDVTPEIPFTFDAADGNPTVRCRVYSLTINPLFYDLSGNQTGNQTVAQQPSSWSIRFPNGTITTVSSSVTYTQTQTGYYQILNVTLNSANFSYPESILLNANTVWSPRIDIFTSAGNQTFGFDSNSTLTEPTFDTTRNMLNFTVSGPSGTSGYAKIIFAKNLTTNTEGIVVRQDGSPIDYSITSTDTSSLLAINYTHSTHTISVIFGANTDLIPELPSWTIAFIATAFVLVCVGLLVYFKKRKHPQRAQSEPGNRESDSQRGEGKRAKAERASRL